MKIMQSRAQTAVGQLIFDYGRRMAELGMNFAELARRLGVSRARVSGLMSGRQNPTIGSLMRVAEILGCYLRIELAPLELPAADEPYRFAEKSASEVQSETDPTPRRRKSPILRVAAQSRPARGIRRPR